MAQDQGPALRADLPLLARHLRDEFGVGVATGIVLSFEFGLGFARFAQIAGPAIGPIIALEVLTAFFLEAGFLGVMLFGLNRVGPKLHFFATCMVVHPLRPTPSWICVISTIMHLRTAHRAAHLTA